MRGAARDADGSPAPANPYKSPRDENFQASRYTAEDSHLALRWIFYLHLLAIFVCTVLTMIDTGRLRVPEDVRTMMFAVSWPFMAAWIAGPIAMLITIARVRPAWHVVACTLIGELVLVSVQFLAMTPLVQ